MIRLVSYTSRAFLACSESFQSSINQAPNLAENIFGTKLICGDSFSVLVMIIPSPEAKEILGERTHNPVLPT
jgi:hypothetical protein